MILKKAAMAGTLESSDAQVIIEPNAEGLEISIQSAVIGQYGKQIRATVEATLARLGIAKARVIVVDKGAYDCTIKARVECAAFRAAEISENLPWGVRM